MVLDFHKELTVTGFKYTVMEGTKISDYGIWLRDEEGEWIKAAEGKFDENETQSIYFTEEGSKNIASYKTSALKLEIRGQKDKEISISELDVLGVTGDNVDFRRTEEGTAAIGRLSEDYVYGDGTEDPVRGGSRI